MWLGFSNFVHQHIDVKSEMVGLKGVSSVTEFDL